MPVILNFLEITLV